MAALYTIFSAFNYQQMRALKVNIHNSIKTFYFGGLHAILTAMYIAFAGPEFFCFWNAGKVGYPLSLNQFLAASVVGVFSWINQESLGQSLVVIKQGTLSTFNNLALVVSLTADYFVLHYDIYPIDMLGSCMIIGFNITVCLLSTHFEQKRREEEEE